jgi:hypothetical protein
LLLTSLVGVVLVGLFATGQPPEYDRLRVEQAETEFVENDDLLSEHQVDGVETWLRDEQYVPGTPGNRPPHSNARFRC